MSARQEKGLDALGVLTAFRAAIHRRKRTLTSLKPRALLAVVLQLRALLPV